MKTKHKAEHITIFAVCKIISVFGEQLKTFVEAFPDLCKAEQFAAECQLRVPAAANVKYVVDEMPAIMKAWTSGC